MSLYTEVSTIGADLVKLFSDLIAAIKAAFVKTPVPPTKP
jgi:hypothetical protein